MKYIVVVDDSEIIRSIVEQTLRLYNYTDLILAKDGLEALEKIKPNLGRIALYVLDVNMPRMDGLTLVKEIRKLDSTTPIIMLTTETDKSKMIVAKENGATGWIIKPFEGERFVKVVEMYVKK